MILKSNEEVIVHKVELATRLAHMFVADELKYHYAIYEYADTTVYKEHAQKIFDVAFDMYISVIEEVER
jgi:hypothetical protein